MLHEQTMENLATCLRSLDTVTLLRTLHKNLVSINRPIRKLPEIQLALNIVLERMDWLAPTSPEFFPGITGVAAQC